MDKHNTLYPLNNGAMMEGIFDIPEILNETITCKALTEYNRAITAKLEIDGVDCRYLILGNADVESEMNERSIEVRDKYNCYDPRLLIFV